MFDTLKACLAVAAAAVSLFAPVHAQSQGDKAPVRIVVPWAAGGTVDFTARQLAQKLTEETGRSYFVENKAGGSGTIGTGQALNSAPDGTTVLFFEASYATLPALFSRLPWDHEKGFTPVGAVIETPMVLVVPAGSPFQSVQDLIAYAKANPGKLNFASGGVASTPHLTAEMFKRAAGLDIVHIPFKGGGDALLGVMGGNADMLFTAAPTALPHVKNGKVRLLAHTGTHAYPAMPGIPSVAEAGKLKGFQFNNWYGLAYPRGTPAELVRQLNADVAKAFRDPALRARFVSQGAEITLSSPEAFGKMVHEETKRLTEASRQAGIKPE
jgi:tripartite-type tricarboxylate transporter receptor subunit TctC